jgi:uncharacterized protein YrrD
VRKSKGPGDFLRWEALVGLGPDALTVDSPERLADPPEALKQRVSSRLDLLGRTVLTDHGHRLGRVRDVEFDPTDGRVTSLLLKDAFVDGERLLGIGHFAVVVRG